MSLKNLIKKSLATFGAISILFSNCSMCGIGLMKVIAEEVSAPEIVTEITNEKYVQYTKTVLEDEKEKQVKGVAIQSKLSIAPNYNQDTYLPTEKVEAGIYLPRINGYLPERAMVIDALTESTTGEELNNKIYQNYDSNSGLLTIAYENTPDENQNIYSSYNENAKDEFEIMYIYPAEAYTGNENELELSYSVNAKMTFKTESGSVTSEFSENIKLTEKDNKGDLTTFGVTNFKENIYKGFMYSNVENKTNYDTEFSTISTLAVLNSAVIDEMTMELKDSKFELNDEETKVSANKNIIYKSTEVSKYEFDRMLGQGGQIEFYQGENVLATVKYVDVEETKKIAVVYSEEDVRVLDDNATSAIVEYGENITSLKIKTSNPITEGFIHFKNENVIKASEDYGCEVADIKNIYVKSIVNEISNNTKIELSEPKTRISVASSNLSFSTLQTSKTTLTINLDNTNSSTKLFDNPTITIKLPERIKANVSSPNIVNGKGLKIKGTPEIGEDNRSLIIELEGKQTSYDLDSVSGGTNIVMDIENIDFKDTVATHVDKIEVICIQDNEEVKASQNINIVSRPGLLMLSEITGYDSENSVTSTLDSNVQNVKIENNVEEKEAVQTITLVNNYNEDLTDIQIMGRIGYSNNEISSTFDTLLTKEIKTNSKEAKVYYSTSKDATYNDESWSEEFTTEAKMYKVVLKDNKLAKGNNIVITEYIQIPEKLEYNEKSYINTQVDYKIGETNQSDSITIVMATKVVIARTTETKLITNLTTVEDELPQHEPEEAKYDIGSTVEYHISVKNNVKEKVNNVGVEFEIPEYLTYTEGGLGDYDEFYGYSIKEKGTLENNIFKYNIEKLDVNEEKIIVVRAKVQTLKDDYEVQVSKAANVYLDGENYKTDSKEIIISQGAFKMDLKVNTENKKVLDSGDIVEYIAKVENIGKNAGFFDINYDVPEELEVTNIEYYTTEENRVSTPSSEKNINLTYSLYENEVLTIIITCKVKKVETDDGSTKTVNSEISLVSPERDTISKNVEIKINTIEKLPEFETWEGEAPQVKDENNNGGENKPGTENGDNGNQTTPDGEQNPDNGKVNTYKISGIAWIDSNKNGSRESEEKYKENVTVRLINNETKEIVKDEAGNEIKATTNANGEYSFDNLKEGVYLIIFEFDTNIYTVTTYQKSDVEDKINSDAILKTATINNEEKLVAITDNITLKSDRENIDIGLLENPIFDLSLDKKITKATVKNSQGTEVIEYEDGDTAKVDLVAKYMNTATVIVNYKFTITNNGDIPGYVNSLVDDLPSGLEFSSELNSDWYKGNDGKLYTKALSNTAIKPGESIYIELVLTKKMTEDNTGVFPNNAELKEISNLKDIKEREDAIENNKSSAILFISIKTGSILLYTGITILCISIILAGTYLIKKKVLDKTTI